MTGNICVYCPGGPDSDFEYSTQSYTGYEPTSMRAIRSRYDPFLQARHRVEQLKSLGHSTDKVFYKRFTFKERVLKRAKIFNWDLSKKNQYTYKKYKLKIFSA